MSKYQDYLKEINERASEGLHPLPINGADLVTELVTQIKEDDHEYRKDSLHYFIYNVLPGTTAAATVKAAFLKEIILGKSVVEEITPEFAFEQLSHMKGGPSIEVLIDLVFEHNETIARQAAQVMKTQVFLYEADMDRLEEAYQKGNELVKDILESYAEAEFFTKLPDIEEEIKVVTYVAGVGDISTDLLSPGKEAHSRADRELHGKCSSPVRRYRSRRDGYYSLCSTPWPNQERLDSTCSWESISKESLQSESRTIPRRLQRSR